MQSGRFHPNLPPRVGAVLFLLSLVLAPLGAQSNHAASLLAGGAWHLHSRVPLGFEGLLLQPSMLPVEILATAEVPAFEGWTLTAHGNKLVLLDAVGHPVEALPKSMTFRVTVSTRDKFVPDSNLMPLDCTKPVNDFLLDMHFHAQVFRGMEMRQYEPVNTRIIGVPVEETSDERVYRATFDLEDVRPDARIVLLVTDGDGNRLTKFHLEFL